MADSAPQKRLACVSCTRAKRKCDKQTPACRRCILKKSVCRYPAPRITPPYDLVYSPDGVVSVVSAAAGSGDSQQIHPDSEPALSEALRNPWFLSPLSWAIDHKAGPLTSQIYFSDEAFTYFINQLQGWLRQWATEGHCAFIHSRLWKVQLPGCIQDAYTTLAAYLSKTPATERMIHRIIEERVSRLVEEQNAIAGDLGVIMLDPATHLARTQALLIYKIIRLFDGDIRARSQAETHIDILALWARQLWQSASVTVSSEQTKEPLTCDGDGMVTMQLQTNGTLPSTWKAWIFSESIRRTYLVATLTEAVYTTLKQGWAPCPGGIIFTGGTGLWEASSPYAWAKHVRENNVITTRCIDGENLFTNAKFSDVDEFCHTTMVVSYGLERFEQWQNTQSLEDSLA